MQLINAYRVRGHLIADLDPLGAEPSYHPELDPGPTASPSGIWTANSSPAAWAKRSAKARPKPVATLREILETLRQTYCGKIGCEYMNIQVPEQKRWLQQRMEPEANNWPLDRETPHAHPAQPDRRPKSSSTSCTRASSARSASRSKAARPRSRSWTRLLERAADRERARNRHRHGAPRPAQRAGQHRRQGREADLLASSKATSIPPARRARAT